MGNDKFENSIIPSFNLPKLSPDLEGSINQTVAMANRTFKDIFGGEIRGGYLISIKDEVSGAIAPCLFKLYDIRLDVTHSFTGYGGSFDYEICKIIIGIHHANTVFLSKEENNEKMRSQEYKDHLIRQSVNEVCLRRYAVAYFRNKSIIKGERFIYYPVPYTLFVFCMRMNEIISS